MEGDEFLWAGAELTGRERDDMPAVNIQPLHPREQFSQKRLPIFAPGGDHLDARLRARAVYIGRANHANDQPRVAIADEIDPELDASENVATRQVVIDVIDRPLAEGQSTL